MTSPIDSGALLTELSDGVLVSTKEGEILYSNPALAAILGYTEDELRKRNVSKDLVERALDWKALVSLLEQGSIVEDYEIKFRREDGALVWCSISASNFRDSTSALIGLAIVLRDISTRKGVENELREKAFRIDVMNKIARIASAETDLRKHALVNVCTELSKLISFDMLTVGITEENGRHVELITPEDNDVTSTKSLGFVPLDGSIVEKIRIGKTPMLVLKDAGRKPFSEFTVIDASGFASMMCIPLISRGKILGSVNVYHKKPGAYNMEFLDILQMVADQVSGLIDNMILLNSLEKRVRTQEAMVRTGAELQNARTDDQIYSIIASNLKHVVPFTELSFYLVDWAKRLVHPVYAVGPFKDQIMASPGTLDEGVVGSIAKNGRAEFMDDVDSDPRTVQIPGVPKDHNSMLAIPLATSEGVIGILELYRPKGQVFTISDLEAGQLFAQQASVALTNARVMAKLHEAKKEIEMLNDLMFHDISNFNFATLNYIQMIAGDPLISSENKAHLEKSLHLIRHTADLIENVKKLTKIGVMDQKDFVPVDLSQILRKISSGLENSFPGRELSVSLDIPETCYVMANTLVEELFVNL
ncbi:MAG: GAF domain-containing protein, partial [Thermoplasmata archaeon]|nr:GAF domain-containing protein [Thermoplasmata archaeon]